MIKKTLPIDKRDLILMFSSENSKVCFKSVRWGGGLWLHEISKKNRRDCSLTEVTSWYSKSNIAADTKDTFKLLYFGEKKRFDHHYEEGVYHTGCVQVFQQQCISKSTFKVLLFFCQTMRSNGRSCCFLKTAICAWRETLVKTLWLTKTHSHK